MTQSLHQPCDHYRVRRRCTSGGPDPVGPTDQVSVQTTTSPTLLTLPNGSPGVKRDGGTRDEEGEVHQRSAPKETYFLSVLLPSLSTV